MPVKVSQVGYLVTVVAQWWSYGSGVVFGTKLWQGISNVFLGMNRESKVARPNLKSCRRRTYRPYRTAAATCGRVADYYRGNLASLK